MLADSTVIYSTPSEGKKSVPAFLTAMYEKSKRVRVNLSELRSKSVDDCP
jgi:hypothetical protein